MSKLAKKRLFMPIYELAGEKTTSSRRIDSRRKQPLEGRTMTPLDYYRHLDVEKENGSLLLRQTMRAATTMKLLTC